MGSMNVLASPLREDQNVAKNQWPKILNVNSLSSFEKFGFGFGFGFGRPRGESAGSLGRGGRGDRGRKSRHLSERDRAATHQK